MNITDWDAYNVLKIISDTPTLQCLLKENAINQLVSQITDDDCARRTICELHPILSQKDLLQLFNILSLDNYVASTILNSQAKLPHDHLMNCVKRLDSYGVVDSWKYLSPEMRDMAVNQVTSKWIARLMLDQSPLTDSQRAILQDISS